jgi:hypothetical protein
MIRYYNGWEIYSHHEGSCKFAAYRFGVRMRAESMETIIEMIRLRGENSLPN